MLAWERQPDETSRAYEAFVIYRDLGPERSLTKVAQELGKSRSLMARWCSQHAWVDRVAALEARDSMIRQEALEDAQRERAEDYAERMVAVQEKALANLEIMAEQERVMLSWPLSNQEIEREDENGNPQIMRFYPSGWSKATAASYHNTIAAALRGERAETGDESEVFDFSQMSDEDLQTYIELSEKLKVKRSAE